MNPIEVAARRASAARAARWERRGA